MSNILISESTEARLNVFLSKPAHGVILTGEVGVGKRYVADQICKVLLEDTATKPGVIVTVEPEKDKKEISVAQIREAIKQLNLKNPGTQSLRRVLSINSKEALSNEVQNTLLKTLEEPPPATLILIQVESGKNLLPTIKSRIPIIQILPVGLEQAKTYFKNKHAESEIVAAWYVSGGNARTLGELLTAGNDHPVRAAMDSAKHLFSQDSYSRLVSIDNIIKNQDMNELLSSLDRLLSATQVAKSNTSAQQKAILKKRLAVVEALEANNKSANKKLLLSKLMLEL